MLVALTEEIRPGGMAILRDAGLRVADGAGGFERLARDTRRGDRLECRIEDEGLISYEGWWFCITAPNEDWCSMLSMMRLRCVSALDWRPD